MTTMTVKGKVHSLGNPGSREAVDCRCPMIDNHYGKGRPSIDGPRFFIREDCPIHGLASIIYREED